MQCGCDCGVLAPPSVIGTPGAVLPFSLVPLFIPAANIVAGWDARDLSASPVALWPDASGNGFDLTQATGANQPTWGAATGPNGQPAVLFDGINDSMGNAALDLPVPGTTPTFVWAVYRQVTWALIQRHWNLGVAGNSLAFRPPLAGISPELQQFAGSFANLNSGMTVNVYKRLEVYFSDSTADFVDVGGVHSTGASAGNVDPAVSVTIGANATLLNFGNIQICEYWIFNALPSTAQLAALDAYAAARYGAGVLT